VIKGVLVTRDSKGTLKKMSKETDCHKYCQATGKFNWRWKFKLKCPVRSASLVVSLVDNDVIGDDDPIYLPKVVPLGKAMKTRYYYISDIICRKLCRLVGKSMGLRLHKI
jgi:hypothetical protein